MLTAFWNALTFRSRVAHLRERRAAAMKALCEAHSRGDTRKVHHARIALRAATHALMRAEAGH